MLQALTDLLNKIFKPVNAFFSGGTGSDPPAQGGDVISPAVQSGIARLVDRLPAFAEIGAPTLLEQLRIAPTSISTPSAAAPLPFSINEVRKPAELEEITWRASA